MITTVIFNRSGLRLTLKEGNAGVYCIVAVISDGESFTVSLDPNSTYREYVIFVATVNELVLSSDELADCEAITVIWKDKDKKLDYDAKPRGMSSSSRASTRSDSRASTLFNFLRSLLRTK